MKNNLRKFLGLTGVLLTTTLAHADNFIGNGDNTFDGAVGNGVLKLTDNGTNFTGQLIVGGAMNDTLVIYIDTGASGGFGSTSNFNDQADGLRIAISGVTNSLRSTLTFTNGFSPKYAIALGPNYGGASFGGLYLLANGSNNSLTYLGSVNLAPYANVGPFTFSFPATSLGLTNNAKTTLRFFGTYINNLGYRSSEAIGGNIYGSFGIGYHSYNQTGYATYTFANPTTTVFPLILQVDMKAQIANGTFKPANGDTVYAAGSFLADPWSSFQLTPLAGNTNIYIGTNLDYNAAGVLELYKFWFHSGSNNVWEFGGPNENRPNTSKGSTQTLPPVYYNDVAARPSATTNAVTFQIDLAAQVSLGRFRPGIDQIDVIGTFQTNQWSTGFNLTNNPTGANTNLYSGTYRDGNYPGTWEEYKFVIISNSINNYESINNRIFYTPTNAGTLAIAYLNNASPYTNRVTFKVDMSLPILSKDFSPASGDTVGAAGTFQTNQWTAGVSGFQLTNNPTAASSNIFSGTYTVSDQPGTGEYYKFAINKSDGSTVFEIPASTSGGDRPFVLSAGSQTISNVWADAALVNYLTKDTYITFTVDMNNAVDIFGVPFDPNNDVICVDGDFIYPQWDLISHATVLFPYDAYSSYFTFVNNPAGSTLYQATFLVAAGHPLQINYKYGIYHNSGGINAPTLDNEAYYGQNHTRYIRTASTNSLPVDYFGIQVTNAAAAMEPVFGNLAIAKPVAGKLPVTWLGYPNVHLQTCTNLVNNSWQDVTATTGLSSTNWPVSGNNQFFRLIQP